MKIATFNANSIRSRTNVILRWLDKHQPDVLAIQETKVQDAHFPLEDFLQSGYEILFKGQKSYNGVAVFSKIKPTHSIAQLPGDPTEQARFLKAQIGPITLINTYVPQGNAVGTAQFEYKLRWFGWLKDYLEQALNPHDPIVWAGDLNVALHSIDVHDPERLWGHVCFCEPVQKALLDTMQWGFEDLFRKLHPDQGGCYTFWDYRVPNGFSRNLGWRLDYLLTTPVLTQKCTSCTIDVEPRTWETPSDHTFLLADFNI